MCIHGDKSQPERDWVLNGESIADRSITWAAVPNLPRHVFLWPVFFRFFFFKSLDQIDTCQRTSLVFVLLISVLVPFCVCFDKTKWENCLMHLDFEKSLSRYILTCGRVLELTHLSSGKWAFTVNQIQITSSFGKILLHSMLCFTEFRSGKAPILIATDVASRGLGLYT